MIDNQAAVSLLGEGPVSWRTRHLKLRAQALRWRLTRLDWRVCFIPGSLQVADLATKPLAQQRMRDLMSLLGMGKTPAMSAVTDEIEKEMHESEKVDLPKETTEGIHALSSLKLALFVGALMTQIGETQATRDTEDIDDEKSTKEFTWMIVGYTIVVMIFTLGLQRLSGVVSTWLQAWGRQRFQRAEIAEEGDDLQGVWREPDQPVEVVLEREVEEPPAPPPPLPEPDDEVLRGPPGPPRYEDLYGRPEGSPSPSPAEEPLLRPEDHPYLPPRFNVFGPQPGGPPQAADRRAQAEAHVETQWLYITPTGERYHDERSCNGLRQASSLKRVEVCRDCLSGASFGGRALFGGRHHQCLHLSKEHARTDGRVAREEPKRYLPCRYCVNLRA